MIDRGFLQKLPDQFKGCVQGRTLIFDGDGLCYRVSSTVKRMDTAIRRYQQEVLTLLFITQSQDCTIHLTSKGSRKNGRFLVNSVKPYQGQRKSKDKPPLLEPLREAVAQRENWLDEYSVILHRDVEADDGIITQAHANPEHGVVYSEDKDMRLTPYQYWEIESGVLRPHAGFGSIWEAYTPSGTLKVLGHGRKFFWAQCLMGDQADNIAGITRLDGALCGPAKAYAALKDINDESACANFVLSAYSRNSQNIMPEAYLLWLLRTPDDNVFKYISSLNLTEDNQKYLSECLAQEWFRKE